MPRPRQARHPPTPVDERVRNDQEPAVVDEPVIASSGVFQVRPGEAERFVERWSELITWTRQHYPEMGRATLSQHDQDLDRFVSYANWCSAARRENWRADPAYQLRSAACRELCVEYVAGDYHEVIAFGDARPRHRANRCQTEPSHPAVRPTTGADA